MPYVDGFVLPVPKRKLAAYRQMAKRASRIWRKHGALEYRECAGDDLRIPGVVPFPRLAKAKPGETVVFAWIVYKSRAHRDRVMAAVLRDPAMDTIMQGGPMPFDVRRMAYGGFRIIVEA
jgi:uncharacterized protein YbaA (DUF1428 family)